MSQVIMLFLFPIGLYFYFFKERPARPDYFKTFSDFETHIQNKNTLQAPTKIHYFKEMLLKNDYKVIDSTDTTVTGEKKLFSMSLFTIGIGLYFIGAFVYLLYFYTVQKPHRVTFHVGK